MMDDFWWFCPGCKRALLRKKKVPAASKEIKVRQDSMEKDVTKLKRSAVMLAPGQKSIKRKLEDVEKDEALYLDPRHSILSISMSKLKTCPPRRVEPSLRRSVLIFNTLKIIEHELQREGVVVPPCNPILSLPVMETGDMNMHILPNPDVHPLTCNLRTAPIVKGVDLKSEKITVIPDSHVIMPLRTLSQLQPMDTSEMIAWNELSDNLARLPVAEFVTSPHLPYSVSMSSSPVKVEDLLSDLDVSFHDLDFFSPLTANMKLPPLSADEIVHSFSGHNTTGLCDHYSSIMNTQCCKSEVISDDLDNIMQILVNI